MKKTFTFLVLSMIAFSSFAQETGTYDELMQKSRRARTISTIMVSTGPAIAVGGIGTMVYGLIENELAEPSYIYDVNGNYTEVPARKYTREIVIGAIGTVVGLGVALSSIIFSNKAHDLKRQARKMKLKTTSDNLSIPGLQGSYVKNRTTQYKLSLLIPFGR
jgi:hypothetical protein